MRVVCLARVHPAVGIAQDDASENLVFCPLALVIVQIITNKFEVALLEDVAVQVLLFQFTLAFPTS